MFTTPLSAKEYRILVDVKYRPGADSIQGWALRDQHGFPRGWHPRQAGSQCWAHSEDAFRAFVPETTKRRHRVLLGWKVVPTTGLDDLATLLRQARGDVDRNDPSDGHNVTTR